MSERPDDELAAELRALGAWMDVPEPADQRAAVRARLARPAPRRRRRWWAASVVVALAGTVTAVAPARAAVVDAVQGVLRVAGIEVRRDAAPPDLPARPSPLPSLRAADLTGVRRTAPFPIRVPAGLGTPEQVLTADPDRTGAPRVVTFVYRGGTVRLDQLDGRADLGFGKSAADAEWVMVGPDAGIWLPRPHPVTYVGRDGAERTETARLAGPTLIWGSGPVTYRLEGLPTRTEAVAVASSLR